MAKVNAFIKSATVNVGKKEITLSFVMHLNDENMRQAEELTFYIGKSELNVTASPRQINLPLPDYSHLPIEKGE
jgi:hypothetical protein